MPPTSPLERMRTYLSEDRLLSEDQKRNIERKAEDLAEGRLVWKSTPVRIQLETNRRCNLSCVHCDIRHSQNSVLDPIVIEHLFEQVGSGCVEVMPYLGGEPTLAPFELLAPLMRRHNNYLSFTTNGVLCTGDFFRDLVDITGKLTFSVHAHRKDLFDQMVPGTDFELIVRNMKECLTLCNAHDVPMLAGLVVMAPNFEHLSAWFEWIADLGFRHATITNLYPNTARLDEFGVVGHRRPAEIEDVIAQAMSTAVRRGVYVETHIPEAYYTNWPENRPTQRTRFDVFADLNSICSLFAPGFCPALSNMVSIEWDGTVLPCCRNRYPVGNLYQHDFQSIWNGSRMQRLRDTFFQRRLYTGCVQCRAFFSDDQAPNEPPMEDLHRVWQEDHPDPPEATSLRIGNAG